MVTDGLDDLRGLSQPTVICDSVILCSALQGSSEAAVSLAHLNESRLGANGAVSR